MDSPILNEQQQLMEMLGLQTDGSGEGLSGNNNMNPFYQQQQHPPPHAVQAQRVPLLNLNQMSQMLFHQQQHQQQLINLNNKNVDFRLEEQTSFSSSFYDPPHPQLPQSLSPSTFINLPHSPSPSVSSPSSSEFVSEIHHLAANIAVLSSKFLDTSDPSVSRSLGSLERSSPTVKSALALHDAHQRSMMKQKNSSASGGTTQRRVAKPKKQRSSSISSSTSSSSSHSNSPISASSPACSSSNSPNSTLSPLLFNQYQQQQQFYTNQFAPHNTPPVIMSQTRRNSSQASSSSSSSSLQQQSQLPNLLHFPIQQSQPQQQQPKQWWQQVMAAPAWPQMGMFNVNHTPSKSSPSSVAASSTTGVYNNTDALGINNLQLNSNQTHYSPPGMHIVSSPPSLPSSNNHNGINNTNMHMPHF